MKSPYRHQNFHHFVVHIFFDIPHWHFYQKQLNRLKPDGMMMCILLAQIFHPNQLDHYFYVVCRRWLILHVGKNPHRLDLRYVFVHLPSYQDFYFYEIILLVRDDALLLSFEEFHYCRETT